MRPDIRRKQARNMIHSAIRMLDEDGELPDLPDESFWLGNSDELTREQINAAVMAFALTLDLTSCNSGGRNLYELFYLYLRNPDARDSINDVLKAYGKPIF